MIERLRVLVTGTRERGYENKVGEDLLRLLGECQILTVVHGNCPTGVDAAAKAFCASWRGMGVFVGKDVIEEPHDAAWNALGLAAGPIRNTEMVALGADLCLAYLLGVSKGTRDCMKKAKKSGISVWDMTEVPSIT